MKFRNLHIILLCCLLWAGTLPAQHDRLRIPDSIPLDDYPRIAESIVRHLENHGYPFATVRIEASDPEHGNMAPKLLIDTGLYVTIDSIILQGDAKLSRNFLYPYLGIRRGMPYSEQVIKAVDGRLAELSFADVIRESGVAFVRDKAYLYVYLNPRRTNQFDGYIGIVPRDERTGKVGVAGELDLSLNNLFRIGESIALHWRSTERYSQYLQITARFPYIYRSRFGVEGSFELDKRDTSFLTLDYRIGIPYSFWGNSYIEPYFHHTGSTLLDPNLFQQSDTTHIDYRKNLYGLKIHVRRLDYLFNPRKGVDVYADLSAGTRRIIPNSRIEAEAYEGLPMKQTSYRLSGRVIGYIPAGRHFVIAPCVQAGSLLGGPHYYNEMFNISGIGLIRGFNANEIIASTYLLYSLELRFLFNRNSYVNLFFDGGTYERQLPENYLKDNPFGFGAGVHIGVKAGTFYLEYALGRQLGNPISFKTGKIHVGIAVDF
ncbi:MAG: hypothetical protein IKQ75_06445 [Bacteroidales bacterium]|nr:hypothetical protein [Bacteroidales bacterium]